MIFYRTFFACLTTLLVLTNVLFASCSEAPGLEILTHQEHSEIERLASEIPFGTGNMWRATKGDSTIHLIGTIHLHHPNFDTLVGNLRPTLLNSDLIFAELTLDGLAKLQEMPIEDPSRFFIDEGPTLITLLPTEVWKKAKQEFEERHIPGFLAAKLRPWYASMALMLPPCAAVEQVSGVTGLDHRLLEIANDQNIPTVPLDDIDTLLAIFEDDPLEKQLDDLMVNLSMANHSTRLMGVFFDYYFDQNFGALAALSMMTFQKIEGKSSEEISALEREFTEQFLIDRNSSWVTDILHAAVENKSITVISGALHLAYDYGLPALLAEKGYQLERVGHEFWPKPH